MRNIFMPTLNHTVTASSYRNHITNRCEPVCTAHWIKAGDSRDNFQLISKINSHLKATLATSSVFFSCKKLHQVFVAVVCLFLILIKVFLPSPFPSSSPYFPFTHHVHSFAIVSLQIQVGLPGHQPKYIRLQWDEAPPHLLRLDEVIQQEEWVPKAGTRIRNIPTLLSLLGTNHTTVTCVQSALVSSMQVTWLSVQSLWSPIIQG